jgi:hypothetical protein
LAPNVHSSHDLHGPEAKRFRVKLTDLNIRKIDPINIFSGLLEGENLKSQDLAYEHPAFTPTDAAAVVFSPELKSLLKPTFLSLVARQKLQALIPVWLLQSTLAGSPCFAAWRARRLAMG